MPKACCVKASLNRVQSVRSDSAQSILFEGGTKVHQATLYFYHETDLCAKYIYMHGVPR